MIDIYKYFDEFFKGTRNPTLKAMKFFMNKYNNFEKDMKFIHIAGTNGKGSCTEIMSNILVKQGYKVGKFLSPHLVRYNERISINGIEISDQEMSDIIEEFQPIIKEFEEKEKAKVTLFELETFMALLYFYKNNVDFVVLETGLGGLYDCTNIISKPLVSIITSIGFDHTDILGNTLKEIAFQKAGIIKENSNTVIFNHSNEINKVFIEECNRKNNSLHILNDSDISNYHYDENLQYFDFKDMKNLSINLKGKIQIKNACLCIETTKILNNLGYKISNKSIKTGLNTVVHHARMEILKKEPLIIFDGAHNVPAMKVLQDIINMYYKNYKRIYIVSILKRKDYKKMLEIISKDENALFILTGGIDKEKYVTAEELADNIGKYVNSKKIITSTLENALSFCIKNKDRNTVNFIIGSFYTYGAALTFLNK